MPRFPTPHMKRPFLALFAIAVASMQPLCAQPVPAPASAPVASVVAPAPPALPAPPAPPLDPIAAAAARDLLEAMRFKFTLAADMRAASNGAEQVLRQIVTQKINGDAKLTPAARTKALAELDKMMPEAVDALQGVFTDPQTAEEISKETARIYARTFSAEELVQIAAFYKTPTGAKLLGMTSRIHGESLAFGRRYMARRIDLLVEEMLKNAATDSPSRKDAK